ncbi:MAG: PAS domain S-box protein [Verrucomicrobiaceae bacterium]|nr:MAG: PAS domain S-box protein [Verrucomicrobiaceae bacterium]
MAGAPPNTCPPEQLLNHLPHLIWTTRADGFTTFVNEYGRKYLGVDLEDLVGWGWLRCVHPADVVRALEAWTETIATGRAFDMEFRMRVASGDYCWQHCTGNAIRKEGGGIDYWIGSCVEIERWKQQEHHLRSANRQIDETIAVLSLLENQAQVGFGIVDNNLRYIRVNDALAEINGVSRFEHLGRTVEEVLPRLWQRLRPVYETVLKMQQPVLNCRIEGETPAHPGEPRQWLTSYHPVVFGDEFLGVGMIVREITAQRQVEQQLHDLLATQSGAS